MPDEALTDDTEANPAAEEAPASVEGDGGVPGGSAVTTETGPPPLVMPEGMTFSPTCGGCGLQFAEAMGGAHCPNCGTPVL